MNALASFLATERKSYSAETGCTIPEISPEAVAVSSDPLVRQYVSTRLHYYGGGSDKAKAARQWALEAVTAPQRLD